MKQKEFNLKKAREELIERLQKEHPDIIWRNIFTLIKKQDKEFIDKLKEECNLYIKAEDIIISIDKLAGEKLI